MRSKISVNPETFSDELLEAIDNEKLQTVGAVGISCEDAIKKRRSILTLEFPFKTDAVTINQALISHIDQLSEHKTIKGRPIKDTNDSIMNRKHQKDSFKRFIKGESIWPKAQTIKYDLEGQVTIGSKENLKIEELLCGLPQEELFKNINAFNLEEDSKTVYTSRARGYIGTNLQQASPTRITRVCEGLDCHTLATYFNYLEERCLKSDLLSQYQELIGIRLLFYAPLEASLLNNYTLGNIDELAQCLKYGDEKYILPQSFIELVRATHKKRTPLLRQDTKQLTKLISRTSDRAGLNGKITATLIRRSQEFIAYQEGYVKERLPAR